MYLHDKYWWQPKTNIIEEEIEYTEKEVKINKDEAENLGVPFHAKRITVKNPDDTASVTVTLKKDEVAFCITKRILGINFNVMTTVYNQEAVELFKTLDQRK